MSTSRSISMGFHASKKKSEGISPAPVHPATPLPTRRHVRGETLSKASSPPPSRLLAPPPPPPLPIPARLVTIARRKPKDPTAPVPTPGECVESPPSDHPKLKLVLVGDEAAPAPARVPGVGKEPADSASTSNSKGRTVRRSSKAQVCRDGNKTGKRSAKVVEGSTSPRYPDWVMLNKVAVISSRHRNRNETTADSHTSQGQPVEVSFWLAEPPAVSHFSVHCPSLQGDDFSDQPPVVICAQGPFVLFSLTLNVPEWGSIHHFVYSAGGPAGSPSLRLLPVPDPEVEAFESQQFGLLPCGAQHYAVVFLDRNWIPSDEVWEYHAYLYSSKMRAWITTKVPLTQLSDAEMELLDRHYSCKQITVGPDSLGWVDLLCGIVLLCNLFDDNPIIKYIPFPSTRICITDADGVAEIAAEHVCDVTCCGDLINFVQIDFDDPGFGSSGVAWKATTWSRKLSWDDWYNRRTVDVAEISVDGSYSALLPELLDDVTQQLQLKDLIFMNPTLSTQDDTRLYIMAKVNIQHDSAWVLAIDMKHAALEALVPISTERHYTVAMCSPCAFPKYLNNFTAGADMTDQVGKHFKRHRKRGNRKSDEPEQERSKLSRLQEVVSRNRRSLYLALWVMTLIMMLVTR